MKQPFLVLIITCIAFGCRSQYEKMVIAKSAAVDEMYLSAKTTLDVFDTEDKYIDKDTIVSIDLLDIDFQPKETTVSAINYATIYHYMLLLEEYPKSIIKITGYDTQAEKDENETSNYSKERATSIQKMLVGGFSIPSKRILISNKSANTCTCAKVKLIQPHLAFSTQLELLKEKGDSLNLPFQSNFHGSIERDNPHLMIFFDFLKANPDRKFQIHTHTDSRGTDDNNLKLSQKRSQSIKDFLVSKGINTNNLETFGHGESQPVNHCVNGVDCSDEEHSKNRRVVIKRI